jgi:Short C-terminal domain/Domain of unknown function (DUF4234)
MATTVLISGSNDRAKIRNPWGVLGLAFITLGVYLWFWWYYINREMRDLGRARGVSGLGDSPGLSCAAWILGGFFLIPLIWTIVTTTMRVARAQRVTDQPVLNGWLAAVVWIFTLGLGGPVFTQYQLNKVWSGEPVAPPPSGAPAADADLDRLSKVKELHESGALSDEEFEAEKARILAKSSSDPGAEHSAEGPGRSPG